MGDVTKYPYPRFVWSHAGGWWRDNPATWKRHTLIAGGIVFAIATVAFEVSRRKEEIYMAGAFPQGAMVSRDDPFLLRLMMVGNGRELTPPPASPFPGDDLEQEPEVSSPLVGVNLFLFFYDSLLALNPATFQHTQQTKQNTQDDTVPPTLPFKPAPTHLNVVGRKPLQPIKQRASHHPQPHRRFCFMSVRVELSLLSLSCFSTFSAVSLYFICHRASWIARAAPTDTPA